MSAATAGLERIRPRKVHPRKRGTVIVDTYATGWAVRGQTTTGQLFDAWLPRCAGSDGTLTEQRCGALAHRSRAICTTIHAYDYCNHHHERGHCHGWHGPRVQAYLTKLLRTYGRAAN